AAPLTPQAPPAPYGQPQQPHQPPQPQFGQVPGQAAPPTPPYGQPAPAPYGQPVPAPSGQPAPAPFGQQPPGVPQGVPQGAPAAGAGLHAALQKYKETSTGQRWTPQNQQLMRVDLTIGGTGVLARQGSMVMSQGKVDFGYKGAGFVGRVVGTA
ncbi:stress protein, partial [Streptomyces sp. DSM 41886]|nr:stress protein [Streptomyces sp. DSM 41886]